MSLWGRVRGFLGFSSATGPAPSVVMSGQEAAELMARRRVGDLVGDVFTPNMTCLEPGEYALTRRGELVLRHDGRLDLVTLRRGQRFPPGLAVGDRWRRLEG